MSFLLPHLPCFLSLPLHGFIWKPVVQKVSHVPDQIPKPRNLQPWAQPMLCCCFWAQCFTVFSFPPSVKGYFTHWFRCRPAGNSWKGISVCTLYLNSWVGTWQNCWGFSNYNFTKMLLSSETQTQCEKLKEYESLGYVEMLKTSDWTEWFSFWISRISHASLYIDLGLILRYKFFVTSKSRLF